NGDVQLEQGLWEAHFDAVIGTNVRRHQRRVGRNEIQFPSILSPDWIRATRGRDLTFLIHRGKGGNVNLVLSRVVQEIGQPLAVRGKTDSANGDSAGEQASNSTIAFKAEHGRQAAAASRAINVLAIW